MVATNLRLSIVPCAAALVALAVSPAGAAAGRAADRRSPAAAPVVSVASGGESIPTIRTARGVTTMLSLPEEAREAICGDLYDAQSGNGGFVIQRSGRDLFLKPLRAAGETNLFVKTERATYAFELVVVRPSEAMRIVRVEPAPPARGDSERDRLARECAALDAERAAFERERTAAAADLDRRRAGLEREAGERAETLAREWIVASVRRGGAVTFVARREARGRQLDVTLGDALVAVGGRGYLSCTIRNRGREPVTVAAAELVGTARLRIVLDEVVPPGGASTVVIECDGAPTRDTFVRLLDPAGAELVAIRPFR